MNSRKWGVIAPIAGAALLVAACASAPERDSPQYAPWHYTFTVLLTPDQPGTSRQLDMAMSLLQINFPEPQTEFINKILYSSPGPSEYKDIVIERQREEYRKRAAEANGAGGGANWRYAETMDVKSEYTVSSFTKGIVIERTYESWYGGAHPISLKDHYVLDLEECQNIQLDDLFTDFRGDAMRKIVYAELRKYGELRFDQPLSEGIFFRDEPELTYNFFVTKTGLGLYWNPADIAAYVHGSIKIIIPWRTIRPFLRCASMDLLTKFDIYLLVI